MKNKKYQFIWREFGISNLVLDLMPYYFKVGGVIIYEKPGAEGYATLQEIQTRERISFELCKNEKEVKQLIKKARKLAKESKDFFDYIKKINIKNKNDKEIYLLLNEFSKKVASILEIYFITEPFFGRVEKVIKNSIFKKIKDKRKGYKYLSDLANYSIKDDIFKTKAVSWFNSKISNNKISIIEKELNLSKEIKIIAKSVRELGLMRINLAYYWRFGLEVLELIINEIARRKYLAINQVNALKFSELRSFLLYNKELPFKKLNLRKEKFVYIFQKGKTKTLIGKDAERCILIVRPSLNKKIKEFKGNIASPGIVKGKVRVFRNIEGDLAKLITKIKKNDIFVTEMTRPQTMPIIKKASAIITDEGGINCHAAIISRELGIPCIIGTEIATKVLKDGDLVEVDANKGIVRILKKR